MQLEQVPRRFGWEHIVRKNCLWEQTFQTIKTETYNLSQQTFQTIRR